MKTAVVIIAYKRPEALKRLLASLENAVFEQETELVISVDKSDSDEVEQLSDAYVWPFGSKRVIRHEENLGLRRHILSCGDLLDEYDAIVVLEDDLTVSPQFMRFALAAAEFYRDDDSVAGISLYSYRVNFANRLPFEPLPGGQDVYMMRIAMSWGQVWMRRQWNEFREWYSRNSSSFTDDPRLPECIRDWGDNSWLKYHIRYCVERNKYFVYPYDSYTTNNNERGVHASSGDSLFQSRMDIVGKNEFRFAHPANSLVRYDAFFEAEFLAPYLGLNPEELCVDLYGLKQGRSDGRYLLTCRSLPYRVLRSFALVYRPQEVNVMMQKEGGAIFLYDTSEAAAAPEAGARKEYFSYWYGDSFRQYFRILGRSGGIGHFFREAWRKICKKNK